VYLRLGEAKNQHARAFAQPDDKRVRIRIELHLRRDFGINRLGDPRRPSLQLRSRGVTALHAQHES
jgi:hypothetical protein